MCVCVCVCACVCANERERERERERGGGAQTDRQTVIGLSPSLTSILHENRNENTLTDTGTGNVIKSTEIIVVPTAPA